MDSRHFDNFKGKNLSIFVPILDSDCHLCQIQCLDIAISRFIDHDTIHMVSLPYDLNYGKWE